MQISESIIHKIKKTKDTSGPGSATVQARSEALPIDENLKKLGEDVLGLYSKLSVAYGVLGPNNGVNRFPAYLRQYIDNATGIAEFTVKTATLLAEAMSLHHWSTTSFPVFFSYTRQDRRWLLIAVLKLRENVGLDEETLNLNSTRAFDISHLREAARIDIDKWISNEQPYLSFIKRSSGSDAESSQYFRSALSCTDYTDAKHNTAVAIKAIDEYCDHQEWDAAKKQEARSKMYSYCRDKKESDQPVILTALSAYINDQDPDSFVNFVRERQYQVSESFSPHPSTYKYLRHISKKFGGVSVGFDVQALATEKVYYDEDIDALVIANPPQDLIDDINKALGRGGSHDGQIADSN